MFLSFDWKKKDLRLNTWRLEFISLILTTYAHSREHEEGSKNAIIGHESKSKKEIETRARQIASSSSWMRGSLLKCCSGDPSRNNYFNMTSSAFFQGLDLFHSFFARAKKERKESPARSLQRLQTISSSIFFSFFLKRKWRNRLTYRWPFFPLRTQERKKGMIGRLMLDMSCQPRAYHRSFLFLFLHEKEGKTGDKGWTTSNGEVNLQSPR